jgi:hypothetical protein
MVFALVLLLVSILAYQRTKNRRVLIVSFAFAIFFVKGIILTLGLIYSDVEGLYSSGLGDFLDLMILVLLAATILKN